MSKKKKAQLPENHEVSNEASEENQMEVANNMAEETTPATIVEATEAEIFATQTETQEAVVADEAENRVVEGPAIATESETVEQPAQAKKERVSKRPYIQLCECHYELGDLDKKELLALIMEKHPEVSKNGVSTFLTDSLNPRYSHWKDRVVSKTVDGKLIFADKIEPLPEEPSEIQAETPAE